MLVLPSLKLLNAKTKTPNLLTGLGGGMLNDAMPLRPRVLWTNAAATAICVSGASCERLHFCLPAHVSLKPYS